MSDDQAITQAATRAKLAYRNGDDLLGDYWAERAQRLSDQAELVRQRFLASGSEHAHA